MLTYGNIRNDIIITKPKQPYAFHWFRSSVSIDLKIIIKYMIQFFDIETVVVILFCFAYLFWWCSISTSVRIIRYIKAEKIEYNTRMTFSISYAVNLNWQHLPDSSSYFSYWFNCYFNIKWIFWCSHWDVTFQRLFI